MATQARTSWPFILIAVAIASMAYACVFLVWFYRINDGPGLVDTGAQLVAGRAALLAYPVSVVLAIVAAIGLWRMGRAQFRERRRSIVPWLASLFAAWLLPVWLLHVLPDWDLPALVRNADAAKGEYFACRQPEPFTSGETVSPGISERVEARFPPGSSARALEQWLATQQFEPMPVTPCRHEPSVHAAWYLEHSRRLTTVDVKVYWKSGSDDKIVWTKAVVSYSGL